MPPPADAADPGDLDFLREWREPVTPRRLLRDSAGSIAVHILLIAFILSLPEVDRPRQTEIVITDVRKAVHLVAPKFYEPTQRAPNQGKVSRELDVNSMQQTPQRQAPRFRAPAPAPGPVAAPPVPTPVPAPVIQPPKIEVAQAPPPPTATAPPQPPPPQPPAPAKPKLAFEDVASTPVQTVSKPNPNSKVPPVSTSMADTIRNVRPGAGGTIVGDVGDSRTTVPSINDAASAGKIGSNLQLLSDARGVDFKPYLIQVLTAVRRNWLAIIPESARLGRRGRVLIQFAIDRNGAVPKLVIAEGTGTDSLDRAAVAAISASYPFPPLPVEYKGDQIRLQLAFAYNMPPR